MPPFLLTLAEESNAEMISTIGRESLVLLTAVIFFGGTVIVFKMGIIPALVVFREGTVGLAQASENIKAGIRENLELAQTLRDIEKHRRGED
jgi:hypothetical protein